MEHKRKIRPHLPPMSAEEDAEITATANSDPDNPIWTAETFARARPVADFPDLVAVLKAHGKLGRPALDAHARKHRVTLYLDPDILAALKADGKGWQTRANAALRKALNLQP